MNDEINIHTWHTDRQLPFCPEHFVLTKTKINKENMIWIEEKLKGRYCLLHNFFQGLELFPAFEDPKEAMLFELTWSN
jgi:hypothetical protein